MTHALRRRITALAALAGSLYWLLFMGAQPASAGCDPATVAAACAAVVSAGAAVAAIVMKVKKP